ncbi:hypothetical protein [Endozoicomonas sp. ONNA2]|uniref:hypothetical protein n=1 Tax=Endozoicomonas sp. ONNA2 TaxID=2828741 RepID=UPI002147AC74|nr:hypothetical protein [Endozoicomonas sp. ONNA2]
MINVDSAGGCLLCQPTDATPSPDTGMVNCARGHAFHRECLIRQDCFRQCPRNDCDAHIPCFVKPLADRLAGSLLPVLGLDWLLEGTVMADVAQSGVSLANARQWVSESEILIGYLRHSLPESLRGLTGRSAVISIGTMAVVASVAYLLQSQPELFGFRSNSADTP